jgi:hypothetical protein
VTGDCDDENAAVWPGAPELCDLADNDCDGLVTDEGLVTVVETGFTGPSIQNALDAAPLGGTVRVCPGTYTEILVIERPVLVQGLGGREATFLDAAGMGRAIEVMAGSVILADLTILNGAADEGAGLRASGVGSLTVISCSFRGGVASGAGGGVLLRDVPVFSLSDVRVLDGLADQGGGAALIGSSGLAMDFIARANSASEGGGLYVDGGVPTVENALIEVNAASGSGAGVFAASSLALLDADLFDNVAPVGAACHVEGGLLTMTDGAVRRNLSSAGGALSVESNASVSNISWGLGLDDNTPADVSVLGGGSYSYGTFETFECTGANGVGGGTPGCL